MPQPKTELAYYSFNHALSHNATINMIIGGRGLGKTYGAKKKAIKDFIKNGDMHIYMRRFETEMFAKENYFDDLIAREEFPEWDFRVNGKIGQIAPKSTRDEKKRVWQTLVWFIPLSRAQQYKGVPFPRVTLIIFDEFLIEKSHMQYLPNEYEAFINFYSTVDRWDDRVRVVMLANSVSIMNPYFLRFNITPKAGDELLTFANGFVLLHMPESKKFSDAVMQTKFGQFIAETDYADYAVGNAFSDNAGTMLKMKTGNARYQYTLETKTITFSVWLDVFTNRWYVQTKLPKKQRKFTIVPSRVNEENLLVLHNDRVLQMLRTSFRMARVWFDTPATRNAFLDVFKR